MKNKTTIYITAYGDQHSHNVTVSSQREADKVARNLLKDKYVKVTMAICSGSSTTIKQMTRKKPYWHQ